MTDSTLNTILVVVRGRADGEVVLDMAYKVARHSGASLQAISVVHEDFADLTIHDEKTREEIKTFVRESGETVLEELIEPVANRGVAIESACIWHKYDWRGVLDVANDIDADMIIKGTEFPVNDFVRTPSDWNLLRHADIPVMLVKPINWVDRPVMLAAVDASNDKDRDLNKRVLRRGHTLARALGGDLHVVSVYPSVEHWVGPITIVIDFDRVRQQVRQDITRKIDEWVSELEIEVAHVHTREGHTDQEIQRAVEETGAEITIMGTHHRSGAKGIVLGNTSEKILHTIRSDVEVLH